MGNPNDSSDLRFWFSLLLWFGTLALAFWLFQSAFRAIGMLMKLALGMGSFLIIGVISAILISRFRKTFSDSSDSSDNAN